MSRAWENTFAHWAEPPSESERNRIDNAVRAVRGALGADDFLRPVTRVYVQGSYKNRVNVRQDSDVDLGVLYTGDSFFGDYPEGKSRSDFGNIPATYTYQQFKDDVGHALTMNFGADAVSRGNKAFDISTNNNSIEVDVVPTFVHRRYSDSGWYICGVGLFPDRGGLIENWPERLYDDNHWPTQHYENGVAKNAATGRAYKGIVRILKKLRNEMEEDGIPEAIPVTGFLIECMTCNVPNDRFGSPTWDEDVQRVLHFLWNNTADDARCSEWGEVSDLKYLFQGLPTKRAQAHAFIDAAWDRAGVRV